MGNDFKFRYCISMSSYDSLVTALLNIANLMVEREVGHVDLAVGFELHGDGVFDEAVVAHHHIWSVDGSLGAFQVSNAVEDERVWQPYSVRGHS